MGILAKAREAIKNDPSLASEGGDKVKRNMTFIPDDPDPSALSKAKDFVGGVVGKAAASPVGGFYETLWGSTPGKVARGFTRGVAESTLGIPHGVEAIGRAIPGVFTEERKPGEGLLKKTGRVMNEASERSLIPSGKDSLNALATAPRAVAGTLGGQSLSESLEESAKTQEEFGDQSDLGEFVGALATLIPSLGTTWGGAVTNVGKAAGKVPKFMNFLKKAFMSRGRAIKLPHRTLKGIVDELYRVKELGGKFETDFYKQARNLGEHLEKFRTWRGDQYTADMEKALAVFGKARVRTEKIVSELTDIAGDSRLPSSFKNWAIDTVKDIGNKKVIDLRKAARLRQEVNAKYSKFKPNEDISRIREASGSARNLSHILGDEIDSSAKAFAARNNIDTSKVKTVMDVNHAYRKASIDLENMSKIIGPRTDIVEGGNILSTHMGAERGLSGTTARGAEEYAKVLDNFAEVYPEAAETIKLARAFLAADSVITKTAASPGIAMSVTPGGMPMLRGRESISALKEIPFEMAKGTLGSIQRSMRKPAITGKGVAKTLTGAGAPPVLTRSLRGDK